MVDPNAEQFLCGECSSNLKECVCDWKMHAGVPFTSNPKINVVEEIIESLEGAEIAKQTPSASRAFIDRIVSKLRGKNSD